MGAASPILRLAVLALVCATACIVQAQAPSRPSWDEAYLQASNLTSQLTLHEKIGLTSGKGLITTCSGNLFEVPRLGIPALCFNDGPAGVRGPPGVSAFPVGLNAAATFNRDLIRRRGIAIGEEFRGKGVNFYLGPSVNPIRAPESGRGWEGFGADPFLAGEGAYETIMGVQSVGVAAMVKHLIGNEQEHARFYESSNIGPQALNEVYMMPFERAVDADVSSAMCSYNRLNGTYTCENKELLDRYRSLGFRGPVVSDWGATHTLPGGYSAGLDVEMPGGFIGFGGGVYGPLLETKLALGLLPKDKLDAYVTRVLASWIRMGQRSGYPSLDGYKTTDVQGNHKDVIREVGAASTVLLKNVKSVLPLAANRLKTVGVIGLNSRNNPDGINACSLQQCNNGILVSGWGSGSTIPPYVVSPIDAIRSRLPRATLKTSFDNNNLAAAADAARGADVALVVVSADSGEFPSTPGVVDGNFGDRKDLNLWYNGDNLVKAVAAVNPNTVVVANAPGAVNMEEWIEHPNVTAVLWIGFPGQEAGNALVDVLLGDVNPSGRLPFTIARSPNDYPAHVGGLGQVDVTYTEGNLVDYRWFDQKAIVPRFEFGFGMSYTSFAYSDLTATASSVSFALKNTGSRSGTEIPQVYLGFPASANQPPKVLRGFEAVKLAPGASKRVRIGFAKKDLRFWGASGWQGARGRFTVQVGASSRDIRLSSSFTV